MTDESVCPTQGGRFRLPTDFFTAARNVTLLTRHEFDGPPRFQPSSFSDLLLPLGWHATCSWLSAMLDSVTGSLERYMDLLSARQKIVASNIANADTPGFKTKDLDFQSEFASALSGSQPQASEVAGLPVKNDGNNVSLDREARMLAENAMRFNLASSLIKEQVRMVKDAIQEGKSQ